MDVPACKVYVDPQWALENMEAGVRDVCKAVVKEWASIDETSFKVSIISGGITNVLLKVSVEGKGLLLDTVTVRIFGPNTDCIIDRPQELQAISHLSAAGFGAKLIGLFQNGMVQSFIVARTLDPPDLAQPKMVAVIAKELRRFHDTDAPWAKEPRLWVDLVKFMEGASGLVFDDKKKQQTYEKVSFVELSEEIHALKESCDCLKAPVVFSHNDLLSGNIMYSDKTDEVHLIDFEYSSYSYRGYDIGNHFNEYAGFDCDFHLYPNRDAQYLFFKHYLHPESPEETTEAELEALYVEANVYSLASHLFWALWGLLQARFSSIDFDYLAYFALRYKEYKKKKTECLSLIQARN